MIRTKRPKWYIGHYPKFKKSYQSLSPESQWRIKHTINGIRLASDLVSYTKKAQCPTLPLPNRQDYYVLDTNSNGIGKKRTKLLIYVDKDFHIIWPISAKDA